MEKKSVMFYLRRLSDIVWTSTPYRLLLLGILTCITIVFTGYHFGTFDQAVHIPFLKKYADPSLFPNDTFLELRNYHYSFFWFLFIPLLKLKLLEIGMFIVYVLVIFLTYCGLWRLSKTLFNHPLISFLSVLAFIFPHFTFAGFSVFEFSLLNRTFVLPFLLFAIDFYLNKRYGVAFLILGIMYNIHVISVNFVLCMIGIDTLLHIKKIGIKKTIKNGLIFLVSASPVLIWKFTSGPIEVTAGTEWFSTISKGMLYHIYYFVGNNPVLFLTTLGGIASLILFMVAKKSFPTNAHTRTVSHFVFALCLILLLVLFTTYFYPSAIVVQSQIIRAGLYILIFSNLYLAGYIVKELDDKKISTSTFYVLVFALIFSLSPLMLLTALLLYTFLPRVGAHIVTIGMVCVVSMAIIVAATRLQLWSPGIHITPPHSSLYDMELWSKNNTAKDAVFIIPPQLWWFYTPDWRAISERSTVVTMFDLIEIVFAPQYFNDWKERFQSELPDTMYQYKGNVFENMKITEAAYYNLTLDDFSRLGQKYNASYLLIEKPHRYDLPVAYENEGFTLYVLEKSK